MNDQCMDDNINGNRKRPFPPIRPSLKREWYKWGKGKGDKKNNDEYEMRKRAG